MSRYVIFNEVTRLISLLTKLILAFIFYTKVSKIATNVVPTLNICISSEMYCND